MKRTCDFCEKVIDLIPSEEKVDSDEEGKYWDVCPVCGLEGSYYADDQWGEYFSSLMKPRNFIKLKKESKQ